MPLCPECSAQLGPSQRNCPACGAAVPQPSGDDPGPPPPPPPRDIPSGLRKNFGRPAHRFPWAMFGAFGTMVPLLFAALGVAAGSWILVVFSILFCLPFLLTAIILGSKEAKKARVPIRILEHGPAEVARITSVYQDPTYTLNGRNPWAVEYEFTVNGLRYKSKLRTFDPVMAGKKPGQPVHVLYLPEDPRKNLIYPPVADSCD